MYLRLQPYRQSSLALRKNFKPTVRFYGPCKVLERIGAVAYKLQLSATSSIHPLFHVSLLKKKLGDDAVAVHELPDYCEDKVVIFPEAVLKKRVILRQGQRICQGLIKWSNLNTEDATWEDKSFIFYNSNF